MLMKFLGMEIPSNTLEAVEARMRSGSFTAEDVIEACRWAAPRESSDFHAGVAIKLMHKCRRAGTIRRIGHGTWRWVWPQTPFAA